MRVPWIPIQQINKNNKARFYSVLLFSWVQMSKWVIFSDFLEGREASFVSSIFSAGIAYSVTKACTSNKLRSCACERSNNGYPVAKGFEWNQCSDNVQFGLSFAKRFIDNGEKNWSVERRYTTHAQMLMNLHNNRVGREVKGFTSSHHVNVMGKYF